MVVRLSRAALTHFLRHLLRNFFIIFRFLYILAGVFLINLSTSYLSYRPLGISRVLVLHSCTMAKLVLHLPSEILGNVFSLCSSKDLRQARLVSRVFCTVSSVYLFKYQRFDMNAKEKTKLSCILATSQVADNVQELEIIGPRVS